ncbi:sn-glycerol-3-phosphate ABC transporter ATP-binding protein UgpC [Palleronia sp. LCG004]|uniref:ABC transporter ATP-binding protein n=1 Tax=Palleronia sp. LCG004 TaxID=3079304 RepID=UPI002943018C|nr:sn-glycerol-3-phosphate ABC transporter ATP-binding protein UgpC [Palleronia sp. LCG004]WOI55870.1 sn-glycerol-3-phosphate ABC transporter ATP-binding protein UgpC [Palleronia sp. LCG004]
MASLTLKKVTKSFGAVEVIKSVDLEVRDGEFVVLVGPSGCGKSTLLRLIAGLEDITGGDIEIGEKQVNTLTPAQREIAMVFQSYALYPHMSVRKNLSFGLENINMKRSEIDDRVTRAAAMLGLMDYLDRRPKALSGGQRQRVAIGRAIVREPALFLFDEPLSNLDAKLRVQTRGEIINLHRQLRSTMIYVTHDQVEAMTMADRIVVMNAGRPEQIGTPLELFDRPANLFVAGFIGSPRMNFFRGRVTGGGTAQAHVPTLGDIALPVASSALSDGEEVVIGIRPSHARAGEGPYRMRVEYQESLGTETFIYGKLDPADEELTTLHVQHHFNAQAGADLAFDLPRDRIHVFRAADGIRVPTPAETEAAA